MIRRLHAFMFALGLCLVATGAWAQEQRLALVIGNAAYPEQSLKNPANDARAVAASLRKLNFKVIERIDATRKGMEDAILEFGEKLRAGGVGLFYYAGHGVQVRGHNYLVPLDAPLPSEASVRVQAVDVDLVLEQMTEARNRANVVILDACRNNPFLAQRRGAGGGLAAIDAARGTLIAYSTAPGTVAVDGEGANSPYTAGLIRTLEEPGLKVEEMFKRVRAAVVDKTGGAQTPWESSSLIGDLILNESGGGVATSQPPARPAPPPAAVSRAPSEIDYWETIKNSDDPRDYQAYLRRYPKGVFASLAKVRSREARPAAPPPRPAPQPQVASLPPASAPQAQPPSPYATAAPSPYAPAAPAATAAPPGGAVDDLRQRSYERIITILLGQTVNRGTDAGKRNDYRSAPTPKAIAACIDWSAGAADSLRVGSWASSWIPPGAIGRPPRQDALEKCTKGNNTPERCVCQIVDEDDSNALALPQEFATRALRR